MNGFLSLLGGCVHTMCLHPMSPLKEMNTFIQQGHIKSIGSHIKDMYDLKIFHNITVLLYFLSNQCSHSEHKILLSKTFKYQTPNF